LSREVFVAGQVLTAAELNVVSDQSVMVFAGTASRGSAIPSPTEGMMSYLEDSDAVQVYTTGWEDVGADPAILQVVSTTKTDTFTTSSTTFTDLTGLSATITPSSTSSKVLVYVTVSGFGTAGTNAIHAKILRGATDIAIGDASGSRTRAGFAFGWAPTGGQVQQAAASSVLDSPATTSSTTYKVQVRANTAGTAYINRSANDADNTVSARTTSTITLMEVAG